MATISSDDPLVAYRQLIGLLGEASFSRRHIKCRSGVEAVPGAVLLLAARWPGL